MLHSVLEIEMMSAATNNCGIVEDQMQKGKTQAL